jgi:hypothetical protein
LFVGSEQLDRQALLLGVTFFEFRRRITHVRRERRPVESLLKAEVRCQGDVYPVIPRRAFRDEFLVVQWKKSKPFWRSL